MVVTIAARSRVIGGGFFCGIAFPSAALREEVKPLVAGSELLQQRYEIGILFKRLPIIIHDKRFYKLLFF